MNRSTDRTNGSLAADLLKGGLAGAVAVWAMDRVGWAMYRREDPAALRRERQARVEGKDVAHVAAGRLATLPGVELRPEQPHPAGIAVHYALGIGPGALYGVLRHRVPAVSMGRGLLYGLVLFLVQDGGSRLCSASPPGHRLPVGGALARPGLASRPRRSHARHVGYPRSGGVTGAGSDGPDTPAKWPCDGWSAL